MRNFLLLCAALACAVGGYGLDRFGYEVCHRGFPLGVLMLSLPAVGIGFAIAAMLLRRSRWIIAPGAALIMANGYYAVLAAVELATVGIMTCY